MPEEKEVKLITIEELLEMFVNNRKFKLVEVLSKESFQEGHIPGSINIPLDELENVASAHLEKGDTIVVYCASYACHASTEAARILLSKGYESVLDFKAGKRGWVHAGLELEK
ncbi:MAG: rhodanese-like domain-containing protein [Candidatus Bathyarchaeia archaeon]